MRKNMTHVRADDLAHAQRIVAAIHRYANGTPVTMISTFGIATATPVVMVQSDCSQIAMEVARVIASRVWVDREHEIAIVMDTAQNAVAASFAGDTDRAVTLYLRAVALADVADVKTTDFFPAAVQYFDTAVSQ